MAFTKADADRIVNEHKICTAHLTWRPEKSRLRRYHLETRVLVPSAEKMCQIRGAIGKKNYSFALLYDNIPLRCFTVHSQHKKPDGTPVREPHKHVWDELNEGREVYIPDDIDLSDINQAFKDFLAEVNVEIRGSYQHLALEL